MLHNHGVEDNPGYGLVVHPPVGKQLIAIGEAMFGYNGVGWRFTGAVLGIVMVALVVRIVRRISRSTLVGAIAGVLLICDGVSFVAARTALLDGFLTFLVVAAFGALIVDRDQVRERLHVALRRRPHHRDGVGTAAGCAVVAFRRRGAARIGLWDKVVRTVLRGVLRGDVVGVRRGGAPSVPGAATVAGDCTTRSVPHGVRVGAHSVRGLPGQLCAVVRLRDRASTGTRWASRSAPSRFSRCPMRFARCGTTRPRPSSSMPA